MVPRLFQSAFLLTVLSTVAVVTSFHIPDPIVHFGVGAIAGGAGAVAYQPFDYIKAKVQSDRGGEKLSGLDCLLQTLQTDPSKLFRGMSASVTGVAPEKSLKLGVNDVLRDGFTAYYGTPFLPLWSQVVSGAVAGACQTLVSSPMDVMKIRMQTRENGEEEEEEASLGQLLNEVGGLPGLYRGVEACLARDISFTALCMPLYSCLIGSGLDAFSAGALSGILSTFVATPFDMVKTRILTNDGEEHSYSAEAQAVPEVQVVQLQASGAAVLSMGGGGGNSTIGGSYHAMMPQEEQVVSWNEQQAPTSPTTNVNSLQLARQILDKEGLGALFTGANERCVGAIPRFGITLGVHEWLEHYCHGVGLLS